MMKHRHRFYGRPGEVNVSTNYDDLDNFLDADDFIDCFERGCELCFDYGGKSFSATPDLDSGFNILEAYKGETMVRYDTPSAMLDHPIGDKRLRDILQDMVVTERTVPSSLKRLGYGKPENFKSEEEFIDCFNRGAVLFFSYDGRRYALGRFYALEIGGGVADFGSAEAMLDHPIGDGKHLRDILHEMEVTDRPLY
jgi:hypothetical protein